MVIVKLFIFFTNNVYECFTCMHAQSTFLVYIYIYIYLSLCVPQNYYHWGTMATTLVMSPVNPGA